MPSRRILWFSAYSTNLRAAAFARCLREADYEVVAPRPRGKPGSIGELARTLIPNCWFALTHRADMAAGFKPHLNVTLPLLICKLRGMPTWIDVDDIDHAYRTGWVARFVELSQRPFPRLFRIVSYHNARLKDFLLTEMRCRHPQLLRIEQGVDSAAFSDPAVLAKLSDIQRRFGLAEKRVAVYTAHLNVASDLEPVLAAWRQVVEPLPAAFLLVVGGGPLLDHYRRMAEELGLGAQVGFTGEVAHEDVPAYLATAQIAVLYFSPRRVNQYRCSLKLREYLAAGLRVACNDVGELKDYAHLTYQCGSDSQVFAAHLVRLLQGYSDGREQAAHAHACARLDWREIVAVAETEIAQRAGLSDARP